LKGDLRYTNTTVFETFPFPLHHDGHYEPRTRPSSDKAHRLADAAENFDKLRSATCKERGVGLTKIHNELKSGSLPALGRAYDALNDAVAGCYDLPNGAWKDEKETLRRLLQWNRRIGEPINNAR
jgi:hypothetical protein